MSESPISGDTIVKLISGEGHTFNLPYTAALQSKTIKTMLESPSFMESKNNVITFPEIGGGILEVCIQYMMYKVRYSNSTVRIPEFAIEPEIALELLMCSNYLDL